MKKNNVIEGLEAFKNIKEGANAITKAISVTYGGAGKNVCLLKNGNTPIITKDGVTVSKHYPLEYNAQFGGVIMIKQVAMAAEKGSIDGTTTASILANGFINEIYESYFRRSDLQPILVKKGMDKAKSDVLKQLKKISKKKVTDKELYNIASVSTNGDKEITDILHSTYIETRKELGTIRIENSRNSETTVEHTKGFQIDQGYLSHNFVNNHDSSTYKSTVKQVHTIIIDGDVNDLDFLEFLNGVEFLEKNTIAIIANNFTPFVINALSSFNLSGSMTTFIPVKCHSNGDDRTEIMKDLSKLMKTKVFNNMNIKDIEYDDLGECESVHQDGNITIFKFKDEVYGYEEVIKTAEVLTTLLKGKRLSEGSKKQLLERLSNINKGIATIFVGGDSQVETQEKIDRYEDALGALRMASINGIIQGAGVALLCVQATINDSDLSNESEIEGYNIVRRALSVPFKQILLNNNTSDEEIESISRTIVGNKYRKVFDIKKCEYTKGPYEICDPLNVAITSIEKAVSTASTYCSIGCVVVSDQSMFNA